MADKDLGDGPSLELPKLFGRKKGRKRDGDEAPDTVEPMPAPDAATEPEAGSQPTQPVPAPAPSAEPEPAPQAVEPEPPTEPEPGTPVPGTADPAEVTMPLPVPAPEPAAAAASTGTLTEEPAETEGSRRLTAPSLPSMPTGVAAVVTGVLVTLLGMALTWLGLQGCEAVRGTDSCGGPGLFVMLAIMVAMVVSGAALLKALGVPQSGSLSFLGFGILAVVVLTFMLDHLDRLWALVALPVIGAAGYAIAHWVTTRFTEPDPDFTH